MSLGCRTSALRSGAVGMGFSLHTCVSNSPFPSQGCSVRVSSVPYRTVVYRLYGVLRTSFLNRLYFSTRNKQGNGLLMYYVPSPHVFAGPWCMYTPAYGSAAKPSGPQGTEYRQAHYIRVLPRRTEHTIMSAPVVRGQGGPLPP